VIRPSVLILLTLTLVSACATPATDKTGPATRSAPVISAQSDLENWVSQFQGRTEKQIVEELGDGGERSKWQSGGYEGLQLRYKFGRISELYLLFNNDRVVYVTFTVSAK